MAKKHHKRPPRRIPGSPTTQSFENVSKDVRRAGVEDAIDDNREPMRKGGRFLRRMEKESAGPRLNRLDATEARRQATLLFSSWDAAKAFVAIEVETCELFATLASREDEKDARTRLALKARKAYEAAARFSRRTELAAGEERELRRRLNHAAEKLRALGDDPPSGPPAIGR